MGVFKKVFLDHLFHSALTSGGRLSLKVFFFLTESVVSSRLEAFAASCPEYIEVSKENPGNSLLCSPSSLEFPRLTVFFFLPSRAFLCLLVILFPGFVCFYRLPFEKFLIVIK